MPKIVDHEKFREELAMKCFNLFSSKGYSNVTMREIAKELDVSTGLLYHYFPTKESIFEKMFEYINLQYGTLVTAQIDPDLPLEEKLAQSVIYWKDLLGYYQKVLLLSMDFYRHNNPEVTERLMRSFADYYIQDIGHNLHISDEATNTLFVQLLGIVYHSLMTPHSISLEEQLTVFNRMLLAYVKKHESQTKTNNG